VDLAQRGVLARGRLTGDTGICSRGLNGIWPRPDTRNHGIWSRPNIRNSGIWLLTAYDRDVGQSFMKSKQT